VDRISDIVGRLSHDLVAADGRPPPTEHIADVVNAAASQLVDAPIQDFVPLLIENRARTVLSSEGVHPSMRAGTSEGTPSRESRRSKREHSILSLG
jgi:hypothetical protein